MPVVWQNSFDGTPGDLVSNDLAGPGTSGDHGDPIVNLRNTGEVEYVRYGAQAIHGSASLALGAEDAFSGNHGDVQLTQELTEWSISFYLYRSDGGWVRILQDGRVNVTDLYLDYSSGDHFVGWDELPSSATDEMVDTWVRCEARHTDDEVTWRFWWQDPESTGDPDYEITLSADNVTGYLFVQGGGSDADHPPAYLDSIRIGEGEWLGPWLTHRTTTASATLTLVGTAEADSEEEDAVTATGTVTLTGAASSSRTATTSAQAGLTLSSTAQATRTATTSAGATVGLEDEADATRHTTTSASGTVALSSTAVASGDVSLALDYSASHIGDPFEPVDDDTDVVNRVQATRRDGGEETYSLDEGPLGTADPPEGVGVYEESVTLDVQRDDQLGEQAAWRVHLGTAEGYRYPHVRINLVSNPQLTETVAARDTGDALQIINPPDWLPPEAIELMIEGYTETINTHRWDIEFNASPGGLWTVGQVLAEEDGEPLPAGESQANRADTAGCELSEALDEQVTEFDVTTYQGPRWITSAEFADEMPFDVRVGGEVMRVQSITGTGQTQVFTVIRAITGVRLEHPAGESVALTQPAVVAL